MGSQLAVSGQIEGIDGLLKMQAFLSPQVYGRAVREGIKYGAKAGKVRAAQLIGERYNIKAARIKKDIAGPYITGDSATFYFSRTPPSLMSFGGRAGTRGRQSGRGRGKGWGKAAPPGKPFTFQILKGGRRVSAKNVFVATFTKADGDGYSVALRRRPPGARRQLGYAGSGPSIGSIFAGRSKFGDTIRKGTLDRISEQFMVGFKRSMDKQKAGY